MATKKEQQKIEAHNLLEEASEVFEHCIRCGMCKGVCPVFDILREEAVSPRGQGILLSEKVLEKIVFECTLCRACEVKCPLGIKISEGIGKAREALVLMDKGLAGNKKMIENIRKTGNPFGKGDIKEKDKLYCC